MKTDREWEFMAVQVDIKIEAGRFSELFRTELFLGMYSPPVHTVPKPESDTLHLVVDHSSRNFSPNSMIAHEDITGVHLDGIHMLGTSILQHRATHQEVDLLLFKFDISVSTAAHPSSVPDHPDHICQWPAMLQFPHSPYFPQYSYSSLML